MLTRLHTDRAPNFSISLSDTIVTIFTIVTIVTIIKIVKMMKIIE